MRMSPVVPLGLLLSGLMVNACKTPPPPPPPPPPPAPTGPAVKNVTLADVGLEAEALDKKADPCTDFYRFACGGWIDKTKIPGDRSRWVRSFSVIHKRNEADLKSIVEELAKNPGSDPIAKKVGDYYAGCMDEGAIEKAGLSAVEPLLKMVTKLQTPKGAPKKAKPFKAVDAAKARRLPIEVLTAELHNRGIWPLFDLFSGQDEGDATKVIAVVDQNGLGLPDRDMYLKDDDKSKDRRAFYLGHIERMLVLAGVKKNKAGKAAKAIMELETELAKIQKTRTERRDPKGMYNKIDKKGLVERSQKFDWAVYMAARGLGSVTDVNVTAPKYVEGLNEVLKKTKLQTLKDYFTLRIVASTAPMLTKALVDESFALKQKITGQKEQQPRWKRCVASTDHALGEALAQSFVKKRFSPESKKAVIGMIKEISEAFGGSVDGLGWMDPATRKRALEKRTKMEYLIGYPDAWRQYTFSVDRAKHAENALSGRMFERKRDAGKIGKPVNRGEWFMTPPTVNAYYHPNMNHMVFPAGILQPPFFNPKASVAVNMGAMGMVVGHELTHGFDDQGSQYDGDGNLKSWWEPSVRKKFDERTACVDKQYSGYEVLPGVKLKGKLTLGENIADIGGVKLAYKAYRSMRKDAKEVMVADGFNEDQQFFLSLGQIWCAKVMDGEARMRAEVDPHSSPKWRVNGSLTNVPAFAEAFSCKEGSAMRPKDRCDVW